MRTVILLGLLSIADAIKEDWAKPLTVHVLATVLCVVTIMDIFDFCRKNFE